MSEPIIAARTPIAVDVVAGKNKKYAKWLTPVGKLGAPMAKASKAAKAVKADKAGKKAKK